MRWGRRFGQTKDRECHRKFPSRWGGEDQESNLGRVTIKVSGGTVVPCSHCRRVSSCPMYKEHTRHGMRRAGKNRISYCDIYQPMNMP